MAWELLLWLLAFVGVIALVALDAYQLICLSDLESDFINPYDSSSRINAVVIPEFIVQGSLCSLFLLTWQLIPFIIMAPITYYHVQLFRKRKHLMDVTEIFRQIDEQKKSRMVKLAFYFTMFILVIYRLVVCAVTFIIDEDDSPLVSGVY
ncbi:Protein cornichon like 1 [Apostasia shenzhenica]|uniref:Protein cornichon like 1 n=1 Tax=Apostasia shenzhenica TaxID=1088818 RepID=A0A2H9ZVG8_9ASPA|nr:Protein cornichon like 1 [Apostasia shenzhenica]